MVTRRDRRDEPVPHGRPDDTGAGLSRNASGRSHLDPPNHMCRATVDGRHGAAALSGSNLLEQLAMMMAVWSMWKTPGRSTASSKARWAAGHGFAGRPRRRHRPPAELVELDRGVGEAVVWPPAVAAARVLGRGKSVDRTITKSIDMAACGSVDKSTNELSDRDHASDDTDWARGGATPDRRGSRERRRRSVRLSEGVAPSLA
jgi:hypothetical protein